MTLEERIKEQQGEISTLKTLLRTSQNRVNDLVNMNKSLEGAVTVQQEEINRYKHLWETNSQESNEIIADLKDKITKLNTRLNKEHNAKMLYIKKQIEAEDKNENLKHKLVARDIIIEKLEKQLNKGENK